MKGTFFTQSQNSAPTYEDKWRGTYLSLEALETAIPVGEAGWSADIDSGVGEDVSRYIWDVNDVKWVIQKGISTTETASSIKTKYESNANTNAYTDAEKSKLGSIPSNANNTFEAIYAAGGNADITDASKFGYIRIFEDLVDFVSITWSDIKLKLKTYFDTLYSAINHNHNLNDLTEKSYNNLSDKPDLSSLHTHANKADLDNYDPDNFSAYNHNHDSTYEAKNSNIQTHISDSDIHVTTTDKSNWNGKQAALGFTPENASNKKTTLTDSDTDYPTCKAVNTGLAGVLTNPMEAAGDLIYGGANGVPTKLVKGTDGQVFKLANGLPTWADESGGGGGTSLWTAIAGTRASNTTITVVGDQTAIFKKGMIVRWLESTVIKWGMVSIPSTFSTVTTITIIGCVCASIDTDSFKYSSIIGVEQFQKDFAVAGTIGAVLTNITRAYYATEPMYVFGVDIQVGTAGTTNSTTIDININGTTAFTTKPTLATTVAASTTPFTADTAKSLALNDKVTIDCDAIQTTPAVDLYVQLYVVPQRYFTLT